MYRLAIHKMRNITILRYGIGVFSIALAALTGSESWKTLFTTYFSAAIMFTAWYSGLGPSISHDCLRSTDFELLLLNLVILFSFYFEASSGVSAVSFRRSLRDYTYRIIACRPDRRTELHRELADANKMLYRDRRTQAAALGKRGTLPQLFRTRVGGHGGNSLAQRDWIEWATLQDAWLSGTRNSIGLMDGTWKFARQGTVFQRIREGLVSGFTLDKRFLRARTGKS